MQKGPPPPPTPSAIPSEANQLARLCLVKPRLRAKFGEPRAVGAPAPCAAARPSFSAPARVKGRGRGKKPAAHSGALSAPTQRSVPTRPPPMSQASLPFAAGAAGAHWESPSPLKGTSDSGRRFYGSLGRAKCVSQACLCIVCLNLVPQKTSQYVYPPFSGAPASTGDKALRSDPELFLCIRPCIPKGQKERNVYGLCSTRFRDLGRGCETLLSECYLRYFNIPTFGGRVMNSTRESQ